MPKSTIKMKQYGVRVNGVLIRKMFARASEARAWQREQKKIQDDIRAGIHRHLEPTLTSVHAVDFLRSRKGQASYGHQSTWMKKYVLTTPKFRDAFIHELTRADWKTLLGPNGALIQQHKLSPGTHNRVRAMIHKMYEDARREYEPPRATENPIHDIPPLKEPKRKPPIIPTSPDIVKYIRAAYQYKLQSWGIFVMISLNTGLRQSNVMALRWRDVDWNYNRFWIREKYTRQGFKPGSKGNEDEKVLGINPSLKTALALHQQVTPYKADEDFIVTKSRGRPFRDSDVWDAHKRTLKAAGMTYVKPHSLRHTYATQFMARGGSIHDLKTNMFHSSITVTEKYAHAMPTELARRSEVFQVEAPELPQID